MPSTSAPIIPKLIGHPFSLLRVADNHRHLVHGDGRYFLYLGDTAWELFHRLTREEAERYLENRRAKGFTVIQAVAVAELDGLNTPNPYGEKPFLENDPARPNEKFFEHVDGIVDLAAQKGLYIGLLPTWGCYLTSWSDDTSLFTVATSESYGRWLGSRYGNRPNLIWILGGDRPAAGYGRPDRRAHWDAMARGIAMGVCGRGDYQHVLITYHPFGQHSSYEWFHDRPWLSFNMYQSGHYGKDDPAHYRMVEPNLKQLPLKPVLNAEPCYEDMCVNFNPRNGWFDDFDVRQAAYWSVFAGSFGYVYGAHGIWQMFAPNRAPVLGARTTWYDSLDFPGAFQMGHLRTLLLAHDPLSRRPDQRLLAQDYGEGPHHLHACRGDGYAFVYTPYGAPIHVQMDELGGAMVDTSWFNPRDGQTERIGTLKAEGIHEFTPPGQIARGNDWVLVLGEQGTI